jgi:hypothetical protein
MLWLAVVPQLFKVTTLVLAAVLLMDLLQSIFDWVIFLSASRV